MSGQVRCVGSVCSQRIDPSWQFCPYCGADNRPPAAQEEVSFHTHEYLHGAGYCTLCGEAHDELTGYTGRSRINTAATFFVLAIVFALAILNIQMAHAGKPAIAAQWIRGWYDSPWYFSSNRYGSSYRTTGYRITSYLITAAICSILISLSLFFKWASKGGRPYWDYNDDLPWWKRNRWWR